MHRNLTPDRVVHYMEAGQGRPLVWLHGFPVDQGMWAPQVQGLSNQYRVLAPGLTGFGGSSGFPGAPTIEGMAEDVAAWLTAMYLQEPVVLGGLSMGGYVALAFARLFPQRLRGLILADTRAEPDNAETKVNREKAAELARREGGAVIIEQMMPKLLGPTASKEQPEIAALLRKLAGAQPAESVAAALLAMRDRPDSIPTLPNIRTPTLVLVGSEDAITPVASSQTLAKHIPNAQLVEIPVAGHVSNLEQPEAFNAAVRSFLARLA